MNVLECCGETGKTFVTNTILAKVRGHEKIGLATALLGIAETLLDNGQTFHLSSKIHFNIKDESDCHFTKLDAKKKLMQMADLLVIDKISMGHKWIYEFLDRSLQDVKKCN